MKTMADLRCTYSEMVGMNGSGARDLVLGT
jgi:hypothetical protein